MLTARQIFYAHTVLMGSLLFSRIWLLFKPIIIGYKTTVQENKELLGHYAWHRNCHRFALVYLGHIAANLMQLYLFEYSVFMVFLVSLQISNYSMITLEGFRQIYSLAFRWVS